ncbi:MAG: hypothetical protein M3Q32_05985 [Pseudomonadota bacterium]|nr:hypothetical protein [Pseudomonadota bacterium]
MNFSYHASIKEILRRQRVLARFFHQQFQQQAAGAGGSGAGRNAIGHCEKQVGTFRKPHSIQAIAVLVYRLIDEQGILLIEEWLSACWANQISIMSGH